MLPCWSNPSRVLQHRSGAVVGLLDRQLCVASAGDKLCDSAQVSPCSTEQSPMLLASEVAFVQRSSCSISCRGAALLPNVSRFQWQSLSSCDRPYFAATAVRFSIATNSRVSCPIQTCRGRAIFCSGSVSISCHCDSQPMVRGIANSTVNISGLKPIA